jgi:hypothetical protein
MNVIGARRALLPVRLPGNYLLHGFTRERERERERESRRRRRNPKKIDERRKVKLNKNNVLRVD